MESVLGDNNEDIIVMEKVSLKQANQQGGDKLYTAFSEFTNLFDESKEGTGNESSVASPSSLAEVKSSEKSFNNQSWDSPETDAIDYNQNTAGISFEVDVTETTNTTDAVSDIQQNSCSPASATLNANEWNNGDDGEFYTQSVSPVLGGAVDDDSINSARPLLLDPTLTIGSNHIESPGDLSETQSQISYNVGQENEYVEVPETAVQQQHPIDRDATHLMPESAYWAHTKEREELHLNTNFLDGKGQGGNESQYTEHSPIDSVYQSAVTSPVENSDLPFRKTQEEYAVNPQEPYSIATELLRRRGREHLRPVSLRGSDYSPHSSVISPWSTFASPSSSRPSSVTSSSFQSPVVPNSNENENGVVMPLAEHLQDMLHLLSPQNSTAPTPISAAEFASQQQMIPPYVAEQDPNMINTTTIGQDNIGVYATVHEGWVDPNSIFQVGQLGDLELGNTSEGVEGMMFLANREENAKQGKITAEDLKHLGEKGGVPVHWQSQTTPATQKAAMARRKPWSVPKFECPYCSSTFTRLYNLKGHIRAHNNLRPYKCSEADCSKSFTRLHDLKRHEGRTHGIKH